MNTQHILQTIEKSITDSKEREYFWIHEERYRKILEEIQKIVAPHEVRSQSQQPSKGLKINDAPHNLRSQNSKTIHPLRILDVGCFPYHLGAGMEAMGLDVYGIASSHEPIKNPKIKICNIESDRFPFQENFFDIVVFTEVLEHLPQAPIFTLKQINRVLKPGGHLILTTPNITRSINRAKMLLGKSVTYPLHQLIENDGKGSNIYHRHNREYTLAECIDICRRANFIVARAETFVSYTPNRRRVTPDPLWLKAGKIVNYALMLMMAGLRDTVLVIGKK